MYRQLPLSDKLSVSNYINDQMAAFAISIYSLNSSVARRDKLVGISLNLHCADGDSRMLIPADLKTSGNCEIQTELFCCCCCCCCCCFTSLVKQLRVQKLTTGVRSFLWQFVVITQTDIMTDGWREGRRDRCIKIQID